MSRLTRILIVLLGSLNAPSRGSCFEPMSNNQEPSKSTISDSPECYTLIRNVVDIPVKKSLSRSGTSRLNRQQREAYQREIITELSIIRLKIDAFVANPLAYPVPIDDVLTLHMIAMSLRENSVDVDLKIAEFQNTVKKFLLIYDKLPDVELIQLLSFLSPAIGELADRAFPYARRRPQNR